MVSKKLRNKVIAGVLGVSLVGGTVFAATDAGTQLQTWYTTQFTTSAKAVWDNAYSYGAGKIGALQTWFNTTSKTTVDNVETAKKDAIKGANLNIYNTADKYGNQVVAKAEEIRTGMQAQYDKVVTDDNSAIDKNYGAPLTAYANDQIEKALNAKETSSLADVTKEVGDQQKVSEDALKATIKNAKEDITKLIGEKQAAATQSVKDHIDAQIIADKKIVEDATAALEKTKKDNIDLAAAAAQKTATDSLDSIVAGITQ